MYRRQREDGTFEYFNGLYIETAAAMIMNPTAETLAAEGWEESVPEPVAAAEPQPRTEPGMEEVLQALKTLSADRVLALDDGDALTVPALFPSWASRIGTELNVGERLWWDGALWKVRQKHTAQADWAPGDTPALYADVSDQLAPEAGTHGNPIPWKSGMTAYAGKYYSEDGKTYRCTRDSGNPLYYAISALVGQYFEIV